MTVQIALRLPEDVVAYIDELVRSGKARSRADVVARALARDLRRQKAADDLVTLLADHHPTENDFDELARTASGTLLELD